MNVASLLPPTSTALERAAEQVGGVRLAALPSVIPSLWNPATCPEAFLPHLAWALSVDEWDEAWSKEKKRAVVAESLDIHRHKGTLSAIRRALTSIGQPDAVILNRSDFIRCDGSVSCDGSHGCGARWATYTVTLSHPATVSEAQQIKRLLESVGRNAVALESINFDAVSYRCDGSIICNGDYTCGSVNTTLN